MKGKHSKLNVQGAHTYPKKPHFDTFFQSTFPNLLGQGTIIYTIGP